ncbi:neural proliferation differentiation and control protein 1 isoform X1 [Theropithecus gelada]|uniref:neural proliferation differentiation and control protein 1 isoform X1 n=1 Tax=Theropithecus gelada TaxID=9565 RepID=UPI000DC19357|nr:neural proliferation differentiation and control protein 1 isoform X1 [Theropithecus gelada]
MLDFLRLSRTPWGVTAPLPEKVLGGGEAEGAVLASPLWTWVGARDPTPSSPCPVFGHFPSTSSPLPCPHFPGSTARHRKRPHCHHGNPGGRGPPGVFPVLRRLGGTCQEQGGQAWGYFLDGVPPPDGPSPSPGGGRPQPRLEDEIDFLAQELARKESGHSTPPLPKARQRLPEPATLGFSARGQGLELGLPSTPGTPMPTPHTSLGSPVSSEPVHMSPLEPRGGHGDGLALVLILAFCVAGVAALSVASLCWCRLQREIRLTQKTDYAAAKSPGSPAAPPISPGDQRLAHSAEMYHYQHQRQQMLCLERHKEPPKELDTASSDEENEDGDFTVYECPGLAPVSASGCREGHTISWGFLPASMPPVHPLPGLTPTFADRGNGGAQPSIRPRRTVRAPAGPWLTARAAMTWRQTDAHLLPDLETPGEGQGPELPTKNMF